MPQRTELHERIEFPVFVATDWAHWADCSRGRLHRPIYKWADAIRPYDSNDVASIPMARMRPYNLNDPASIQMDRTQRYNFDDSLYALKSSCKPP